MARSSLPMRRVKVRIAKKRREIKDLKKTHAIMKKELDRRRKLSIKRRRA